MAAIGRFGSRVVPELSRIMQDCRARKQLVEGPHIERFEQEFGWRLQTNHSPHNSSTICRCYYQGFRDRRV